jgi:choline-sulfatase
VGYDCPVPVLRTSSASALALIVLAASGSGCAPGSSTRAPRTADAHPRNLLLVTIDTLRADHVGSYGHVSAKTPAFDDLARAGVRFKNVFAPAPITLTSHATLMTGLNPPAHGARHNGIRLRDEVPTLAVALAAQGFATGAFVSAFPLDRRFGLARGFAAYDDRLPRRHDGGSANERQGSVTVDAALTWLEGHRGSRFFLWVHLFEPHAPYGDQNNAATSPIERYDGEIAEADRQLARLVGALGGARSSTLVVATADHGEAFGEHGEVGHSVFVYDTTLRIPLVMNGPGVPSDGRTVDAIVGLVDLAPTLAAMLQVPSIQGDGIDLRPAIEGKPLPDRGLYAESFAPFVDFGWSPLRTWREGRWKYIAAPQPELYDLADDPQELRNALLQERVEGARLAARVEAIAPAALAQSPVPDRETAARLGSLGYVSLQHRTNADTSALPDPKDRKAIAARLAEVTSGEVSKERLVPVLEALLRDDPGNPHAELRLGVALTDRGDCEAADGHLRAAIRSGLPTADPFISLAFCHRQRGATDAASRALVEADRLEPGNPVVAANLGLMAFDAGRMDEAIARLGAAVERDPDLHEARFFLARAYARSGQRAAAQEQAAALLARLPASAPQRPEVERLVAALK